MLLISSLALFAMTSSMITPPAHARPVMASPAMKQVMQDIFGADVEKRFLSREKATLTLGSGPSKLHFSSLDSEFLFCEALLSSVEQTLDNPAHSTQMTLKRLTADWGETISGWFKPGKGPSRTSPEDDLEPRSSVRKKVQDQINARVPLDYFIRTRAQVGSVLQGCDATAMRMIEPRGNALLWVERNRKTRSRLESSKPAGGSAQVLLSNAPLEGGEAADGQLYPKTTRKTNLPAQSSSNQDNGSAPPAKSSSHLR